MAPPITTFPASSLPTEINKLPHGKTRSPALDLNTCKPREMVQYKCNADPPPKGQKPTIVCEPVVRLFRECANGFMIETTAWEAAQSMASGGDAMKA